MHLVHSIPLFPELPKVAIVSPREYEVVMPTPFKRSNSPYNVSMLQVPYGFKGPRFDKGVLGLELDFSSVGDVLQLLDGD